MLAAALAALAVTLPATGVAVESRGSVTLLGLGGKVARTLPGWQVERPFGAPVGIVYLRDPQRRVWRLSHGALERVARLPRVRVRSGCFSTAPHTRICGYPYGAGRSRLYLDGSVVRGSALAHGHWLLAELGEIGRVVAQWSGECELPTAYIGDEAGLEPVYPKPTESFALGWAGPWAVVAFTVAGCGRSHRPAGVYVGRRLVRPLSGRDVAALWR